MHIVLHDTTDQTLVHSLLGLLNCEIGGLDCFWKTPMFGSRKTDLHVQKSLVYKRAFFTID